MLPFFWTIIVFRVSMRSAELFEEFFRLLMMRIDGQNEMKSLNNLLFL